MPNGLVYLGTAVYLTFVVAFTFALLQENLRPALIPSTLRKWGKFLLGLAILGVIVQILTLLQG